MTSYELHLVVNKQLLIGTCVHVDCKLAYSQLMKSELIKGINSLINFVSITAGRAKHIPL